MNDRNDDALVILAKQTTLTETQKSVLRKGLKFIPKPKQLPIQTLHSDIRNFMHRLKTMYEQKTTSHKRNKEPRDPFTPKQKLKPNPERLTDNGTLDTFLHRIRMEMLDAEKHKQNKRDNLTRKERIALKELMTNPHIIINKADKGSTIVVEDRQEYIRNAMVHLNDPAVYKPLHNDISPTLKEVIINKLLSLKNKGFLKQIWFEFCEPPRQTRTSRLYFLKKIHKNPMEIRTIVSSCNSITERISQFVDRWLQPHVRKLPSYLKDTTDFLKLIETTKLPEKCLLTSIDVSSLYTNIPHEDGKQSILYYLRANPDTYTQPEQPLPEVLAELTEIVLKNNVFKFNNDYYLQIQGTAMGTKMAPAYANLFMGKFEEKLNELGKPNIILWKRFIDDIFIIWSGSESEFTTYMTTINQIHRTIKFTYELSETELTFLDVTLYKGERFNQNHILDIRTHIKPTNKQLYVHATSYHPPTTINAISKGETNRYLRTNSNEHEFKNMKQRLTNRLLQRGYKYKQILPHIESVQFRKGGQFLFRQTPKVNKQKLVFVTQFCDDANRLKQIIKKHWKLIKNNKTLRSIFPEPPVIADRNNPSLKQKLV